MHRRNKKRKIVIYSLLGVLMLMAVGYASFTSQLKIKGSSKVTSNWDVEITNITKGTFSGSAEEAIVDGVKVDPTCSDSGTPKLCNKLTADINVDLYEANDSAEYDITISNKGDIDAKLDDIITDNTNSNSAVLITFSGYSKGERLFKRGSSGSSKTVHVKVSYNPEYTGEPTSSEINLTFNFVQAEAGTIPDKNTYTLTYDYETNGGSKANEIASYDEGENVDLTHQDNGKSGYSFVGWNTDSNATTGLTNLTINNNTTLYAIYKKVVNATFDKNGSTSIGSTSLSCNMYNNQTSCIVKAPSITRDGYTVIGWNKDKNATTSGANVNANITLSSNATYYAITKNSSAYTASWNTNGATLSSTEAKSCNIYNTETSCTVDAPTITRDGFTIIGFNTSTEATTNNSSYNALTKKLTISSNSTWYAITNKVITLTFVKGTNTASVGSTSGSCTIQNTATSCNVKTPSITSNDTYVPAGWSTTNGATTGVAAGSNITDLTANATYYGNSIADTVNLSISTSSTTSTITITANAQATSGIKSYEYKINGNNATCKSGTASNICIIEVLNHNTTYTASATVIANSNKTATSSKSVSTTKIDTPTFKNTETASGVDVDVTYPSGCTNYTCQYSLNGGASWITVTTTPYKVSFTESGNIIARVIDKTNTNNVVTSSSHAVEVIKGITAEDLKKTAKTSGTDNGLYKDTSEGITRYIYRGNTSVNNYIYIKENNSNVKYRIYSVESDNTIKVIRNSAVTSMNFDADNANRRKSGYCSQYNYCNAWAAMSSFTNGTQTGAVSKDSSIKEYIDNTYSKTLTDSSKIVSKTWNISGTEYYENTIAKVIANEKKSTWNGKIALLTASEYVRANRNTTSCGTPSLLFSNYRNCKGTNYLYKSTDWWLLSPNISNRYNASVAYKQGYVADVQASTSDGVRPSFYLKSGLRFSGEGTSSNPYNIIR